MGSSKTSRSGPGWSAPNTPGNIANAKQTYSKGSRSTAEGTHENSGPAMRGGMSKGARNKSSSGKTSAKNSGPYGQS